MNERILELAKISGAWDYFNDGDKSAIMDQQALQNFAELIIEEAAKAPLCDSDGVVGKYSDSDRYYFETLMKKQLGLV